MIVLSQYMIWYCHIICYLIVPLYVIALFPLLLSYSAEPYLGVEAGVGPYANRVEELGEDDDK
jgi:hypothetical protein